MLFYYTIFFVLLLFVWIELFSKNANKSATFSLFILLFFFLSFIRWETGTDWITYLKIFEYIKSPFDTLEDPIGYTEVGFVFLNNLVKSISDSYTLMLFVQGLIIYLFLFLAINRFSPYPLFSLLICFTMNFGGIFFVRQTIAISITFFSVAFIYEKKFLVFIFFNILASLIHSSSIIFILAYFVFFRHYKYKTLLLGVLLSAVLGSLIGLIVMDYLASIGVEEIYRRIFKYTVSDYEGDFVLSNSAFVLRGLINKLFVFLLVFTFVRRLKEKDAFFNGVFNIYILGMCLFVFLAPISRELARLTAYFDIFQIIIYPYILLSLRRNLKLQMMWLLIVFFAYRLYAAINQFQDLYIPYKTIFA